MKRNTLVIAAIAATAFSACNQPQEEKGFSGTLTNAADSVGYALGVNIGENLKQQGLEELNDQAMAEAMKQALAGDSNSLMTAEEAGQFLNTYFSKLQESKMKSERVGADSKEQAFLSENGQREEVTTTASGLQYEVLVPADGPKPLATDQVKVHYTGTLLDGTVFDSSVDRGEPAQFGVTQVIPGWVEALQLMSVGDKWKLTIPSELAYGDKGAGGLIGPGETLVFEVELIGIN